MMDSLFTYNGINYKIVATAHLPIESQQITIIKSKEEVYELYKLKKTTSEKFFSFFGSDQDSRSSDKNFYYFALNLSKEGHLTDIALQRGLIPKLTEWSKEPLRFAWIRGVSIQEKNGCLINSEEKISDLIQKKQLSIEIKARLKEIANQKNSFRQAVDTESRTPEKAPMYALLNQISRLEPIKGGDGTAYLATDRVGKPFGIVKPNDEDIMCLHHRKQLASPFNSPELRTRNDIPAYESAQNEALGFDIARLSGLETIVPKTILAILDRQEFYLITDNIDPAYTKEIIDPKGKEKLCSVHEFVPDSQSLHDYTLRMSVANLKVTFNQDDFEMANILTWITRDQNAHSGNYHVYMKDDGSIGLKKNNNNLICGESNKSPIINGLKIYTEQMDQPLSAKGRALIENIPIEKIAERMKFYKKSNDSIQCMVDKITNLKRIVSKNKSATLTVINSSV